MRLVHASDDADLVRRCQAGQADAQRELFERERIRVHRLLYRVVGSNSHMEDLLQEAFLEIFRSLHTFRGDSSLRTWMDSCVVRVAYAHFRRKSRLPSLEPVQDAGPTAPSPEDRATRREAIRHLYAHLEQLEARQRMAFSLHALEGRTLREVAQIMDSTIATAKIRAWRARRTLEGRARKDPLLAEFLAAEPREDTEPSADSEPTKERTR